MRIAISTLVMRPGRTGSQEPYLVNLVAALSRLDDKNQYLLFVTRHNRPKFERETSQSFQFVQLPAYARPVRILLDQFAIPFLSVCRGVDVLHFPGTVGSIAPLLGVKMAITVHYDLDEAHAPSISWSKRLYFDSLFRLSSRNASVLIVPSQSFGQSLAARWHLPSKNLVVAYHGVDIRPVEQIAPFQTIQSRYGLRPGYLLSVTNSLPHKNLSGLLEAFATLRQQSAVDPQLVLVGDIVRTVLDAKAQAIIATGVELPVEDIVSTGFLPHSEVFSLCAHASVMLNPTFTESSSMTVLEAMGCGLPVVASNIPVHREILGDVGVLVDPRDSTAIGEACARLLTDNPWRTTLAAKGVNRAREFSWDQTARQTIAAYELARDLGTVDAGCS